MTTTPATHGTDSWYYVYANEKETPLGGHVPLAREFQAKLLDFVYGRDEEWPVFGEGMRLFNITDDEFDEGRMPEDLRHRCEAINEFVLDPVNGA